MAVLMAVGVVSATPTSAWAGTDVPWIHSKVNTADPAQPPRHITVGKARFLSDGDVVEVCDLVTDGLDTTGLLYRSGDWVPYTEVSVPDGAGCASGARPIEAGTRISLFVDSNPADVWDGGHGQGVA
ncbi:hypothetical protein GCM10009560_15250 [Nonomuraea longicatena]|uniref:Secreted protein n=2 Tax=Nonomuraea longicatena TaxID=83682 RepID=A0ABN1NXP5_9ACTN